MIQIDDSGWGSLVGGVMIGIYNTENQKFKAKLIPLRYFQGALFKTQKYKEIVIKIFLENWVSIGDTARIQICRGYILDELYKFLNSCKGNRIIERKEIKEPLQSMLEEKFAQHLEKYGVPRISDGAHCMSFNDQLQWILQNPKKHIKYVKTGWNSWKTKYSKII